VRTLFLSLSAILLTNESFHPMKKFLHSDNGACKGAALIIVLAFVVLVTSLSLAYLSRTTTNRQLSLASSNDGTADLVARSALDITVSDLKQEIANNPTVTALNIQPARYPVGIPSDNPNLIRYSSRNAAASRASAVSSTAVSANGRSITLTRWNSHYLIPPASATGTDSTPVADFTAPDWVLVTGQGPNSAAAPNAVIGRYAFAVYDEGGLMTMNVGGFPTYVNLTRPTQPARKLRPTYPEEESEIMLAACQAPGFTPDHTNATLATGVPCSLTFNTNHNPDTFGANSLPHGLSINTISGAITGVPTDPGNFTVTLTATNQCGSGTATLFLTINGFPSPGSTPWAVNLARKGTIAFADLTTLPSTPTAITPTTPVGTMAGFPGPTPINKFMGWRNLSTTQQTGASFDTPSFLLASADNYARYFLGAVPPFTTPFIAVPAVAWCSPAPCQARTDQAMMTRQQLIRFQRALCTDPVTGSYDGTKFPQSLLQYLGTSSREHNRPALDWSQTLSARWDMNNLATAIPDAWIIHPGNHGLGHAYGLQRHSEFAQLFGLVWVNGDFHPNTRLTDPNYYGRWKYIHNLNDWPANPDFFQVINNAMKIGNGGVAPAPKNVFTIGAALIDQYDTDDLYDPDPNPPNNGDLGNTITIIDTVGNANPADYVNGIEGMSFDNPNDPNSNQARPGSIGSFCPYPPPVPLSYALLNRRFENVGEFGYAYNPGSPTSSKTLDFASSTSKDKPLLDFFTYNSASVREGTVNLNTRNVPVLASIIRGAWVHDPGAEVLPSPIPAPATVLVSQNDALAAAQAIVQETTSATAGRGPALTRADVARLAAAAAGAVPNLAGSDEAKQAIARTLAEIGQARTWNLMVDVVAQIGQYTSDATNVTQANKFVVQGEKRYWLHIALDRDDGTVLGSQLEELSER
jgi:hypothetical protein